MVNFSQNAYNQYFSLKKDVCFLSQLIKVTPTQKSNFDGT